MCSNGHQEEALLERMVIKLAVDGVKNSGATAEIWLASSMCGACWSHIRFWLSYSEAVTGLGQ